jgi:hypothetical protein
LETRTSPPPLSVSPKPTSTTSSSTVFFTEQPQQTQSQPPAPQVQATTPVSVPAPIKKTVNFGANPSTVGNLPLMLRSSAPVLEGLTPDFFQELAQMEKNASKSPHNHPSMLSTSVSFSMEQPMEKSSGQALTGTVSASPVSSTNSGEKNNKLKKSISMPSVYSTSEGRLLLAF